MPYYAPATASSGVSDGDKGDVTVSGTGSNWQIDPGTVGPTELSATGTPSATTYLRGDNTWASVTATQPDILISLLAPAIDETITAGYAAVLSDYYEIADQKFLEIGDTSVFEIA